MRIAVFGAGRMGGIRVEDLVANPAVTEVFVTNRTDARAAELAGQYSATSIPWSRRNEIVADGYVIATTTDQHVENLTDVIAHGKPILCEKPISMNLADDGRIITLANSAGVPIQMAFQRRFDAGIRELHAHIANGSLGTLYAVNMVSHDHTTPTPEFAASSGGIFRDLHVHDFDLVRWLTGSEVETAYATGAVRHVEFLVPLGDFDTTLIHLVTANGVQVSISGARHDAVGHDVRLEVFGSLDSVTAGVNRRTPVHPADGDLVFCDPAYTGFIDRFREAFRAETNAFVSLVAGEIENPAPPSSAREAMRIAIACEESVRTGGPVRVPDIMST